MSLCISFSKKIYRSDQRAMPLSLECLILDEIYTYEGSKASKCYIFTAVGITDMGYKYVFAKAFKRLGQTSLIKFLRSMPPARIYFSDEAPFYGTVLGSSVVQAKGAMTNLVESFNAQLRQYLSCIRRKTKAFAKSLPQLNGWLDLVLSRKFSSPTKI